MPIIGNDCFSTKTIVYHWPTTMIGPNGESKIAFHFVQSIFSSSWVGMGEKLNNAHWIC
jgi:hypothetical protein